MLDRAWTISTLLYFSDVSSTFRGVIAWPDKITGLAGDMEAIHQVLNAEQRNPNSTQSRWRWGKERVRLHFIILGWAHVLSPITLTVPAAQRVVNVTLDGVRSATNQPLLYERPVIPEGEGIQGQFFPLL